MTSRRALLASLGGLTMLGGSGGAYAFWIEPAWRLAVAEYRLNPPNWPRDRPITILADIHASQPQMPLRRIAEIVEATNALRPDLTVLLGDFWASCQDARHAIPVEETAAVLKGLRAPHGVHSILGNHDWWEDADVQRLRRGFPRAGRSLAEAGLSVLHNTAVKTGFRDRGFWVAGCGSLWAFDAGGGRYFGANDLGRTLGDVRDQDPVILLCQEPDIFPDVPGERVALTLCGHTHGGQVRIAGYSPYVPSMYGNRFAYGHVVEAGRHLVVSGGLGTSILPVRFGVPPEITVIRLGYAAA